MYSYEDRMKAVKLYIKYGLCAADTKRTVSNRKMLARWYKRKERRNKKHCGTKHCATYT